MVGSQTIFPVSFCFIAFDNVPEGNRCYATPVCLRY